MIAKIVEINCKGCPVKEECIEIKEKWFFLCPVCGHEQVDFVINNELGSFLLPIHGLN
jgi:Zn finger protein HypA/HybF involved in hydrogenase expression